jgi:hypothetical protein
MLTCPVFIIRPHKTRRAIIDISDPLGSMMVGHLPPSSKVVGVPNLAAAVATIFPTLGLPVKKTIKHVRDIQNP